MKSSKCKSVKRKGNYRRTHGMSDSILYSKWTGIKQRTTNPNQKNYAYYGGRGIKVHKPWFDNFSVFQDYILATIGLPQKGDEIERIYSNRDYEPGNIKWAQRLEQMNNTRRNNQIPYRGKIYTITRLYDLLKPVVPRDAFRSRITKHKWDIDKAAKTPMHESMQRPKGHELRFFFKGGSYTIAELIEKFEPIVNEKTFRKRLRSGWSVERALCQKADLSRSRS